MSALLLDATDLDADLAAIVLAGGSVSSLTDGADSSADVESGTQLITATAAEFTGGGMGGGPRGDSAG